MGLYDNVESIPRRTMTLFFMIDASGSMQGNKIGAVNDAIANVIPMIQEISDSNPDAEINIAALKFSNNVEWIYDEPKPVGEFVWQDIEADGLTALGEACKELCGKLSTKNGFMKSASGSYAPAILLLSDGEPTDDFIGGVRTLQNNSWFKAAIKIAIAIGDNVNKDTLKEFTGNAEAVITVHNIEALKAMIRIIAVTSSQIGSKSSSAGDTTKQSAAINDITQAVQNTDGAESVAAPMVGSSDDYSEFD